MTLTGSRCDESEKGETMNDRIEMGAGLCGPPLGPQGVKIIERTHAAYPDPLDGGEKGYQGRCHDCSWRGRIHERTTMPQPGLKDEARQEAGDHERSAGRVYEVPQQQFLAAVSPTLTRVEAELAEALRKLNGVTLELQAAESTKLSDNAYLIAQRDSLTTALREIETAEAASPLATHPAFLRWQYEIRAICRAALSSLEDT